MRTFLSATFLFLIRAGSKKRPKRLEIFFFHVADKKVLSCKLAFRIRKHQNLLSKIVVICLKKEQLNLTLGFVPAWQPRESLSRFFKSKKIYCCGYNNSDFLENCFLVLLISGRRHIGRSHIGANTQIFFNFLYFNF